MVEVSKKEDERHWVAETRSNFMEILRGSSDDIKNLSSEILKHLINSLGANQGGLYIINDDNANDLYLELLACYAYSRKKFLTKRIDIGEGLVGQIVREKEYMYYTEIPQNYFKITSGLGEATPRHLLIVPLKMDEVVYGAIEIASFHGFKEFEIDFLLQLGETIASTISTVKTNTKTKVLLEETQQQAEEMKSQQEELQQNMEELETTQEEMQRRTYEIESRMVAVDESGIASIEFELDGTILNTNENFRKLMGYQFSELEGRHHRIFVSPEVANSDDYKQFWRDLGIGKTHSGEFERLTKDGETRFLQGSYSIIRDKNGNPGRVLKLATDITSIKNFQLELQDQAEQMGAQDEELRQNLEELTATQEEIQRRTREIESRMIAVNESGISSIEFELDGTILNANENFLKLMGYQLSEVEGKHHHIFVLPEMAHSEEYKEFWRDLRNGKIHSGEFQRITKNGESRFIQGSYSIIRDANGEPSRVLKLATDITSIKNFQLELQDQAEQMGAQDEELRQNLEELTTIQEEMERRTSEIESRMVAVNESGISSIEFELNGTILNANENFLKLMGYKLSEVEGKHHRIFVPKEVAKSNEYKEFWKDLGNGKMHSGEFQRITKDGETKFIQGSYSIIRDSNGNPSSILKLATDITSIKNFQLELQEKAEQMSAQDEELRQNLEELTTIQEEMERRTSEIESRMIAVNESGISSIEFELDGTILNANDNFLKLMGYQLSELEGKHHRIFVPTETAKSKEYKEFWKDLGNGKMHSGEFQRITKDGETKFIQGSYSIIRDANGNPSSILKLATDITSIKSTQP